MADEIFTEPDESRDDWVDVRMTNPEAGEWDIDVVVIGGNVQYVDLRVRPELLADFVECLIEDVGEKRGNRVVQRMIDREESSGTSDDDDPPG